MKTLSSKTSLQAGIRKEYHHLMSWYRVLSLIINSSMATIIQQQELSLPSLEILWDSYLGNSLDQWQFLHCFPCFHIALQMKWYIWQWFWQFGNYKLLFIVGSRKDGNACHPVFDFCQCLQCSWCTTRQRIQLHWALDGWDAVSNTVCISWIQHYSWYQEVFQV